MTSVNTHPSPPLHIKLGQQIDRHILIKKLGHGWEATAYLAKELNTNVKRVFKFYRPEQKTSMQSYLARVARCCESLADTGAIARYHFMGQWKYQENKLFYSVYDYIDGPLLRPKLKGRTWRADFTPMQALDVLHRMTGKLAAIHERGFALGDFAYGNNIILKGGIDPVWCDWWHSTTRSPYRHYREDWGTLGQILTTLNRRKPRSQRLAEILAWLREFDGYRFNRKTFSHIHQGMGHLVELTRKLGEMP